MATVVIDADTGDVDVILEQAQQAVQNIAEGMLSAASSTLDPAVADASATVWNVRTGDYSSAWYTTSVGQATIEIGNNIEYAAPLETGWTTRGGNEVPSPGVLYPTVYENLDDFVGELQSWLIEQTGA